MKKAYLLFSIEFDEFHFIMLNKIQAYKKACSIAFQQIYVQALIEEDYKDLKAAQIEYDQGNYEKAYQWLCFEHGRCCPEVIEIELIE